MCTILSKYDLPLVMLEDHYSRTRTLDDFISVCDVHKDNFIALDDKCTPKDYFDTIGIPSQRYSVDTKVNNNLKKITEHCQCHDLEVVSGRMGEDKYTGAVTCDDASVTDYVINLFSIYFPGHTKFLC